MLAVLCTACAGLPKDVERPVSYAIDVAKEPTALSALVQQQRRAAGARSASGFTLLNGPQEAYGSRLALALQAQKTLDLQYYAIHADDSTARLLREVVAAARRGVRVRILLDDFHSTGRNALVMSLAFEPHIEMRMFNPVAGTRASMLGRLWGSVTDFSRVQQRMHNKLFIADNVMGVTGGRNLGDAYFGQGMGENFVDLDVLAAGPIVADMSRSFDTYWNNPRSYPVESLITREEIDRLRVQLVRDSEEQQAEDTQASGKPADKEKDKEKDKAPPPELVPPAGPASPREQAAAQRAWDEQPMDLRRAQLVWAPAVMLADKPTKIALDGSAEEEVPPPAPQEAATASPTRVASAAAGAKAQPSGKAAASSPSATVATAADARTAHAPPRKAASTAQGDDPNPAPAPQGDGDTVVDGLLTLIEHTRSELLIISPYFVPGEDMKRAFAEARARGVRVRILTNSLASNDAPIAHVGYARHREELLEMGVELYELRSEQPADRSALGSASQGSVRSGSAKGNSGNEGASGGATGASRSMLHSKVLVVDRRLVVIGSMNLDLRSQLQNTEIALLVRSRVLAEQAARQIEMTMRQGSWHVEFDDDQDLVWRAPEGSDVPDAHAEPDTPFRLRLMLKLLGPLAPDRLL